MKTGNYMKLYFDLFDTLPCFEDVYLISWLKDRRAIFKKDKDGWFRCGKDYMDKYFSSTASSGKAWSYNTYNKHFETLEEAGLIEKDTRRCGKNQEWWFKFNDKLFSELIADYNDESKDEYKDEYKADSKDEYKVDSKDDSKSNRVIHNTYNINQNTDIREQKDDDASSSPSSEQLSIYQPLYDKFRQILHGQFFSIKLISEWAAPLLAREYTVKEMCDVIECKGKEWITEEKMRQWIRPQTLFKPEKFSEYLSQSKVMLANLTQQEKEEKELQEAKELAEKICSGEIVIEHKVDEAEVLFDKICSEKGWKPSESNKRTIVDKIRNSKQFADGSIQSIIEECSAPIELYTKLS